MKKKVSYRLFRIIRWFVWLVSPKFKIVGSENLPAEPCVIVGNHSQMYGPIFAEIYIPGRHHVWCAGEMMHRKEVAEYAYSDFWSGKPFYSRWFFWLLSRCIGPLAECIFSNAGTIAVYHDSRLITTYRTSIAKLQEGSNIVIFPECYTEYNNIVHEFQDKFVDLARFYYRKTGKELCFVPLYLAPKLKTAFFGKPIPFRSDSSIEAERQRICTELKECITDLASSQPMHTVIPYPNIYKKYYPKNLPVEYFEHETSHL